MEVFPSLFVIVFEPQYRLHLAVFASEIVVNQAVFGAGDFSVVLTCRAELFFLGSFVVILLRLLILFILDMLYG